MVSDSTHTAAMDGEAEAATERALALEIAVSEDRLQVSLSCSVEELRSENALEQLAQTLAKKGIAVPTAADLKSLIEPLLEENRELEGHVLAYGTPPTEPVDDELVWERDFFDKGNYIDPVTHTYDFHRSAGSKAVTEGDLILTIKRGAPGENGIDVFGKPIQAGPGKRHKINAGANVSFDAENDSFTATCSGALRLTNGTLSVEPLLKVAGDVDAASGDIIHTGAAEISGNVSSEFTVQVAGDVTIGGILYAAETECGGTLTVRSGITSSPEKRIVVGGELHTNYVDNANIECKGDVWIERESVHSEIYTEGVLHCKGSIVGGQVSALKGMEINEAGCKLGTLTTLVVGSDRETEMALTECLREGVKIKKELDATKQQLQHFSSYRGNISSLRREQITELEFAQTELTERLTVLVEETKQHKAKLNKIENVEIRVEGTIYPGTIFRIGRTLYNVQQAVVGPLRVFKDNALEQLAIESIEA